MTPTDRSSANRKLSAAIADAIISADHMASTGIDTIPMEGHIAILRDLLAATGFGPGMPVPEVDDGDRPVSTNQGERRA